MHTRLSLLRHLLLGCVVLLSGLMLSSCAALSETHRKAVGAFVGRADTLALSPSVVVSELAQIRRHRGVIYSSTLSSHELRMEELELLINDQTESETLGRAADLSARLLRTYAGALNYLAHTNRYEPFGVVSRSIGRKMDGFAADYNALEWGRPLPAGYGVLAGKLIGAARMRWLRFRQARALRAVVEHGDTLVSLMTANLITSLNSKEFTEMIDYEESALRTAYLTRLRFNTLHNGPLLTPADDLDYLSLRDSLERVKALRRRTVSALRSLRNAHGKLVVALQKPRKFMEVWAEAEATYLEGLDMYDDFITLSPWL